MNTRYITKTAAQLVDAYCFEHGRIDREDKEITQQLIKKELRHRFETMLIMMDRPELAERPEQIFEYFTRDYKSSRRL